MRPIKVLGVLALFGALAQGGLHAQAPKSVTNWSSSSVRADGSPANAKATTPVATSTPSAASSKATPPATTNDAVMRVSAPATANANGSYNFEMLAKAKQDYILAHPAEFKRNPDGTVSQVQVGSPSQPTAYVPAATPKQVLPPADPKLPKYVDTGHPETDMAVYNAAKAQYKSSKGLTDNGPDPNAQAKQPTRISREVFNGLKPEKKDYVLKHPGEYTVVDPQN